VRGLHAALATAKSFIRFSTVAIPARNEPVMEQARTTEHVHGWPGSTPDRSSMARSLLLSLCVHAALAGAIWRFAPTQPQRPAQRSLRIELAPSPRPAITAAATPEHSEPKPDNAGRTRKRRPEAARAHASAAEPAPPSSASAGRTAVPSGAAAGAPLEAEAHEASSRPIVLRVLDWLAHYRTYPLEARRARIEGVVELRVTLMADGRLVDARVEQSSGHPLLDRAALDLLARASPLPGEFASGGTGQVELQLPIVYRMRAPSS
jgi:protein TonB